MGPNKIKQHQTGSNGVNKANAIWGKTESNVVGLGQMGSAGVKWGHIGSNWVRWGQTGSTA